MKLAEDVYVTFRYTKNSTLEKFYLQEWSNGTTEASLYISGRDFHGIAICSEKDNFTKTYGRKIAFGRAVKSANLDKSTRTFLWKAYLSKCKV